MAYIERAYLTEQFENLLQDDNVMCPVMKVLDALEIIDTAPTADVVEVVHGTWINCKNNSGYKCSNCGARIKNSAKLNGNHNWCHKCGAKM